MFMSGLSSIEITDINTTEKIAQKVIPYVLRAANNGDLGAKILIIPGAIHIATVKKKTKTIVFSLIPIGSCFLRTF